MNANSTGTAQFDYITTIILHTRNNTHLTTLHILNNFFTGTLNTINIWECFLLCLSPNPLNWVTVSKPQHRNQTTTISTRIMYMTYSYMYTIIHS